MSALRRVHLALSVGGKNIANFALMLFGLVVCLLPFVALCGSIYIAVILVDITGLGFLIGFPILALWFIFVAFYVAPHVQPQVGDAAARLWPAFGMPEDG